MLVKNKSINRMDFVRYGKTIYLVTLQGNDGLTLWDFQAWLNGYYDAYIPLEKFNDGALEVIGNFKDNPELLPSECDGYNGEPCMENFKIDTVWSNKNFNGCFDGSEPCCKDRDINLNGDLIKCSKRCSCHEVK